jgi:hypothetical protein
MSPPGISGSDAEASLLTPWIDPPRVVVFPTRDADTIAARKERALQLHYADLREYR